MGISLLRNFIPKAKHVIIVEELGCAAQSAARLTQKPEAPGSIPGPATYLRFSSSANSRRAVVIYTRKNVREILVNPGLRLPRKSVVWLR